MDIIKEHCPSSGHCVIRTNTYGHSLELIQKLFEVARQDFPELTTEQVNVVKFAGGRYARTYGIEFEIQSEVPGDYSEISQLENTF